MIRLAALYFAIMFGLGFMLGTLRVLFLVPKVGARNAELIEIPLMLVAIYFVAQWIARRAGSAQRALAVGALALGMLLSAEVTLAALLFGKSPWDALLNKDPVSGGAYYLSLFVFAIAPSLFQRGDAQN